MWISCLAIDLISLSFVILCSLCLKYGGLHVIKSNVSVSYFVTILLILSLINSICSDKSFNSTLSFASSNTSFCNSTPIILAFVFVVKTNGTGALPVHKSNISFVFSVIGAKLGNRIESRLKLN